MPRANTPARAARRYLEPFNNAMRCIEYGTLITTGVSTYAVGPEYSVLLNNDAPLRLRTASSPVVCLSLGRKFEIIVDEAIEDGPFHIRSRGYWYQFSLDDGSEILAFHWTPDTPDPQQKTYPHLHVGSALLAPDAPVLPGVWHKRHIPTGRISIESIVRFAIEELGVQPLVPDWSDILNQGQRQFDHPQRT